MTKLAPYWKALVAFVTPGVVGLVAAVQDSSPARSSVTVPEWVGIAAACILTAAGVYGVPNRDRLGLHQDESVQPPSEGGHTDALYLVVVVVLVLILLAVLGVFR